MKQKGNTKIEALEATPEQMEVKKIRSIVVDVIKSMAADTLILDDVTINQPVADLAGLAAIPVAALRGGCIVMVNADKTVRRWNGTAWELFGNYIYVADTAPRLALTSTQVNNGQLVSQLSDKSLWIATVSGSTVTWTQIGGPGSFDPFDAIVDGIGTSAGRYITLTDAIDAGKNMINVLGGSLDSAVININRNIVVYYNSATYNLSNQKGFNVSANYCLAIYTQGAGNRSSSTVGATVLCNNTGGTSFFQGEGTVIINGLTLIQGVEGPLASNTTVLLAENCNAQTLGTNNQFFNIQAFGSKIKNIFVYGQTIGANVANAVIIGNGCEGENIEYYNGTASTGTHVVIQAGGKLSGLKGSGQTGGGGFPLVVLNQGYLERVVTTYPISPVIVNDGGTLANTNLNKATGFAPHAATLTNINTGCRIINVACNDVNISNDATAINTSYLVSSLTAGSYSDLGANTVGYGNNGGIPNTTSGSFDPFDAKVTSQSELTAAIAASKKVIFIPVGFTFTNSLQLLVDTSIYCGAGVQVYQNGGQIDTNNKIFSLSFCSGFVSNGWQYNMATAGQSPFINNNETPNEYIPLQFINCRLSNLSTVANTPVSQTHKQIYNNSWVFAGNVANGGVNISVPGSSFSNLNIVASSGGSSTNALVIADGCVSGAGLTVSNQDATYSSALVTIGENNSIYGFNANGILGGGNLPISSKGQLYGLNSSECIVALTLDGQSPVLNGANIGAGSITVNVTATNPKIMASHATGTFTNNSTTYQGSSNSGSITNTGNSLSLSPYTAAIDNVGALPSHYATFGAAYAAGKTDNYSTTNTAETGDIEFLPSGQLYCQIGQNFTMNLSEHSFVGSYNSSPAVVGANTLTIELADASAMFRWAKTGSALPISNFDNLSTIIIKANGGVLQNLSTAPDTYLYCAGTIIIKDAILLLPNASNGGIKTTSYTQLSGLELTGGGLSCDTALTCVGGSVRDIVIDGTFADNCILIKTNQDTAFDVVNVNVNINGTIEVMGKASKIFSSNPAGFVIVQAKTSLDPNGSTSISDSNFDQLSLATETTEIKVSGSTIGILDLPSDNSTELELSNVTVLNSCSLYGKIKISNCKFPSGFIAGAGATISIATSESGESISWTGVTKSRAANDANIGNDY